MTKPTVFNYQNYEDLKAENGKLRDEIQSLLVRIRSMEIARPDWIPFIRRPPDEYEKANYPDSPWFLDGDLPEGGELILVTVKYRGKIYVQEDMGMYDDDGFYLDSGHEPVNEAVAWMPIPEPYQRRTEV